MKLNEPFDCPLDIAVAIINGSISIISFESVTVESHLQHSHCANDKLSPKGQQREAQISFTMRPNEP